MKLRLNAGLLTAAVSVWLGIASPVAAQPQGAAELAELELETLMDLEVTSVSRKTESIREAAAAIYVITKEDIAHSPATSLPELLRQVPGLQVSQIDGNSWAVSARGFNGLFANKLLVMIDGRSVYTPIFSGVFWDSKDMLLEDIERIEVIRGPGAVMWGANAVNGIINIITKSAHETKSGLVTALGGNQQQGTFGARYGTSLGEKGAIRLYGKYRNVDGNQAVADGSDGNDGIEDARGGFRYDYAGENDRVLVSGEAMRGAPEGSATIFTTSPPSVAQDTRRQDYVGGNFLATWARSLEGGDSFSTQFFFDREDRDDLVTKSKVSILDCELNYQFGLGESHSFVTGLNYRWMHDELDGTDSARFDPMTRQVNRASLFLQDEIELASQELFFTLGAKLEYHDFSGVQPQPSAKLSWRVDPKHTLWLSTSYASRLPSRAENDVFAVQSINFAPDLTTIIAAEGDSSTDSEHVTAMELGYRGTVAESLTLDVTSYYSHYRDISNLRLGEPSVIGFEDGKPLVLVPLSFESGGEAEAFGLELAATLALSKRLSAQIGANFLDIDYRYNGGLEGAGGGAQGADPRHQAHLRFTYQPLESVDVVLQSRYVDSIPAFVIDSYVEGDLKVAYRPVDSLEISLSGTNLFNAAHREYNTLSIFSPEAAIERSYWAGVQIRF
jgi:iron complex outermembrane receptor protein